MANEVLREQNIANVVEQAAVLFAEKGVEQTSLEMVAQAAGVARRSVLNYFSSKTELVKVVLDRLIDDSCDRLAAFRHSEEYQEKSGLEQVLGIISYLLGQVENEFDQINAVSEMEAVLRRAGFPQPENPAFTQIAVYIRAALEKGVDDDSTRTVMAQDPGIPASLALSVKGMRRMLADVRGTGLQLPKGQYQRLIDDYVNTVRNSISRIGLAAVNEGEDTRDPELTRLLEQASRDALTGLLNRASMTAHITNRLENLPLGGTCALFVIDIDDFKYVNDTLGHQTGDNVLRQTAQALSRFFRASDIVGRLGGDEFMVFISGISDFGAAEEKAASLCDALQFTVGTGPSIHLTCSAGVCVASGEALSFDELYAAADSELYKAKNSGKNRCSVGSRSESFTPAAEKSKPAVNAVQLKALLEYMDGGVELIELGQTARLIYISPSFGRLMGINLEDYPLPRELANLHIHPDDYVEYERILRDGALSDEPVEHVHRSSADMEQWHWMHIRAVRVNYSASSHPVMLAVATNVTELYRKSEQLQTSSERLRIAFEQTSKLLWEVDIPTRTFSIFDPAAGRYLPESQFAGFPESMISAGWVHPDSVERFRDFSREILSGQLRGSGAFMLKYWQSAEFGWASMSYHMILDKNGLPVRAIGIEEELPTIAREQSTFTQEGRLLEALRPNLLVSFTANMSIGTVDNFWADGASAGSSISTYDEALETESKRLYYSQERAEFLRRYSRVALLEAFQQGRFWQSMDYQRTDVGGRITWAAYTVYLTSDPITRGVFAFGFTRDVEQRHRWEAILNQPVERDPLTQLYTRQTAEQLIGLIIQKHSGTLCALTMVNIEGLSDVQRSGESVERLRYFISIIFLSLLGTDCLVVQHSTDQLLVFCPSVDSGAAMRQRMEDVIVHIRQILYGNVALDRLHFVAGVSCEPINSTNYNTMLSFAGFVCGKWSGAPEDIIVLGGTREQIEQQRLISMSEDDRLVSDDDFVARPLSGEEKILMFECLSSMLEATSHEAAIDCILGSIGEYYWADRVYTLTCAENNRVIATVNEWMKNGKRSIRSSLSGSAFDRFPVLSRSLEAKRPLVFGKAGLETTDDPDVALLWNYIVFPMLDADESKGFLCVEYPKRNERETALCCELVRHIIRESKLMAGQAQGSHTSRDPLTGAFTLKAYSESIGRFTPNVYTSLGVLAVSVPAMNEINIEHGYEYGSKFLVYIAETLRQVFSHGQLFRVRGSEFVVLSTNCVKEVFDERCERAERILSLRYPHVFSAGSAWSDSGFSASKLVRDAQTKLRSSRLSALDAEGLFYLGSKIYANPADALSGNRFTVYFQPKLDMRTGKLLGAEALVRGLDDQGNPVLPGEFVPAMESKGVIRDLDFFVLGRALSHMDKWRRLPGGVFPVSVNFSRLTLCDSSALASVLAIHSRFGDIPPEAVEIELTETACDLTNGSITQVVEMFHQFGFRFGLDDFGAQYSNLSVFAKAGFDTVKFDKSLIDDIASNRLSRGVVEQITKLCLDGDVQCVAEGVETQEQRQALLDINCVVGQGFLFDKPLSAEEFERKYILNRSIGGTA